MTNAIDIIEQAKTYYLLSKDHATTKSKPIFIGSRLRLEFALQDIQADMIIATSGNDKKCIVLIDYSTEECWTLAHKADRVALKIKAKN